MCKNQGGKGGGGPGQAPPAIGNFIDRLMAFDRRHLEVTFPDAPGFFRPRVMWEFWPRDDEAEGNIVIVQRIGPGMRLRQLAQLIEFGDKGLMWEGRLYPALPFEALDDLYGLYKDEDDEPA